MKGSTEGNLPGYFLMILSSLVLHHRAKMNYGPYNFRYQLMETEKIIKYSSKPSEAKHLPCQGVSNMEIPCRESRAWVSCCWKPRQLAGSYMKSLILPSNCGLVSKLEDLPILFRDGFSCLSPWYIFSDCFLRFTPSYSSCSYNGECYWGITESKMRSIFHGGISAFSCARAVKW